LVTGGCGFIGSHLARELYRKGHFVRIVDAESDSFLKEKAFTEKMRPDLRMFKNCLTATKGIDKVYNLAANMGGIGFITEVGADVMHDICYDKRQYARSFCEKQSWALPFQQFCVYLPYA